VPGGQRGRFVVLNFDNADIETVIHAASEIVGFNYVLAPDVRGKVTVQTSGRIAQEDVFGVLLGILEVHGFTAVKSGNLYKFVRIEGARERAVPTIVGTSPDPARTSDEVITQIVPLRYGSVADLTTILRPLVSGRGNLMANRETNVLIITDSASNIARLLDIVRVVDVEVGREDLQIVPIQYADAAELATILTQLFASGRVRGAGAGTPAGVPPPALPTPTPPGARVPTPGAPDTAGTERAPLILPERRSNSLIIHARRADAETIRRLIGQLDVNIYGGRRVFVYYAENAKAKDLAATLNAIYGGRDQSTTTSPTGTTPGRGPGQVASPLQPTSNVPPGGPVGFGSGMAGDAGLIEGQVRFIADEVTNSIIVTTFPRTWSEIEATIRQLDRMPRQVLIEVLVAEILLTKDTQLGIDWAVRTGSFRLAQQSISGASPPTITPPDVNIPPVIPALGLPGAGLTAFAFASNQFFVMLNAMASENLVNVVSNPHVMTSENKKAVINVSQSVPIVTSQQVPIGGTTVQTSTNTTSIIGTQSVEYRDAGVVLTVTPRIGEKGTVALDVKQEVNDVGDPEPPTGSPRINKREAETSVVLLNNQTLVLGGLISNRRSNIERGIPLLYKIPVLGYIFGFKEKTLEKRELLMVITPRVIGTALDAARVTEEMRRATPELNRAIMNAPRPPSYTTAPPQIPSGPVPETVPAPPPPPPTGPPRRPPQ
jgi:general secretion pathway protein D